MLTTDVPSAELAVLGAVIATGGAALDEIALRADDFTDARHGDVFDRMRAIWSRGEHIDALTLSSTDTDNAVFYWSLTDHAPFASAVQSYADIVAAHGMNRRLRSVSDGLRGISPETPAAAQLERAIEMVDAAAGEARVKVLMVKDILPQVIERLEAKETFVPTPWPTLDAAIGGLRPGAVYVVAARPGIGKSVIAAQLAAGLAEHGLVSFSSLEMSADDLVTRIIAERLVIQVGKVKDNRMTERDWEVLARGRATLDSLNIAIDDRASVSAVDVRSHAKAVSRQGKLAGVVVDYMQLMSTRSSLDRYLQVSEFSRQLKIMAKDFHVPVIALSQLNRQSENRADREPKLSDLRESGAIEQDADVVILLRREGNFPNEHLILDVAKNRHGQTGEVDLAWQGEFSRAVEWGS